MTRVRDWIDVRAPVRRLTASRMALIARIAREHGVTVPEILGPSRHRRVAWPRQEAIAAVREMFRDPLDQIGALFGRHHTTVMHAIRAVQERRISA